MKKILILLLIPILFITSNTKTKDDLIRIRVIANSNNEYDQKIKMNISNELRIKLYELLKNEQDIESARTIIKDNMSTLENIIDNNLDNTYGYTINYGLNYFPEKEYNGIKYKEGNYESLLVKLGKGEGNNWWCILFPPICLIEMEEDNSEEIQYKFFLKDIFDKFF